MSDLPLACQLSDAEFRAHRSGLLATVRGLVISASWQPDGLTLEVPLSAQSVLMELIAVERDCCPFLQFDIQVGAGAAPTRLTITGPVGTRPFLETLGLVEPASAEIGGPVSHPEGLDQKTLDDVLAGLHRGDFSRLAPRFAPQPDGRVPILDWVASGWLEADPIALNEALACACFLGQTRVVKQLLAQGADLVRGNGTGLNGFHWAANRGKLETVRALIRQGCPLEELSSYGGSVLGSAVWAAIHDPRPDHLAIIEVLLQAGASVDGADYPSGDQTVDQLLQRYGAGS